MRMVWKRCLAPLIIATTVMVGCTRSEPERPPVASVSAPANPAATFIPPNLIMLPHSPITAKIVAAPATARTAPAAKPSTSLAAPAAKRAFANQQSLSCTPPAAPNEIVELARALNWNPDLIFEYVHNTIDTLPIYDSLKGAYGALIDGAGTPVDQAELMYVLLQQSCYSPQYEVGTVYLSVTELTNWLGTDTSLYSVGSVLVDNGFPPSSIGFYGSGTVLTGVDVPWVWVSVPIPNSGTAYQFDPASKVWFLGQYGYNTRSTGVANLGSAALQYTQSAFLGDAHSGATGIGTPTVAGINRANVRRDLATYSNNLIAYIKANNPTATTNDIIGGTTIMPLSPTPQAASGSTAWGQTVLCNVFFWSTGTCSPNMSQIAPTAYSNLNQFRTTLSLTLGWNDSTSGAFTPLASATQFNSSDIYGHRLSVEFNLTTGVPSLLLDGVRQVAAGTAVPSNQQLTARVSIVHPHIPTANLTNIDSVRVSPPTNPDTAVFVIGTGWGGTGRGMIEKHRKLLQQNTAANPTNPEAEPVLGEGLAMIGYTWLGEFTRIQQRVTEITGVTTTYLHAVGIIGMKTIGTSSETSTGPYVDLPLNTVTTVQRTNNPGTGVPSPAEATAFFIDGTMDSVFESGSIEQSQPGATAASTIKLIDQWSQSGSILDINNSAISGDNCSLYATTLRGQMVNYGSADRTRVGSLVGYSEASGQCSSTASTTRVIAPSNGALSVGTSPYTWTGTGYLQLLYPQGPLSAIGAIITGGLSGGEPASSVPPEDIADNQTGAEDDDDGQYTPPSQYAPSTTSDTNTDIAAAGGGSSLSQQIGADPVDIVTGSYIFRHTDLSVGSGAFPDKLPFTRTFDSALAQTGRNSSLLGNGWMHSYDMTALPDSDGFEGMGDNSPISGAAMIAAIYVLQDILDPQAGVPSDRVIIAAQAEVWLMGQWTNNVVAVTRPGSVERFVQLLYGTTYNPPLGSATVLSGSSGAGYTTQGGDGVTRSFNPSTATASGKITAWANAAGATVGFAYNSSGQLATVCEPNCAGPRRQLNLHYNSENQLTSVDDNTGDPPRTVSYLIDGNGDLTSVTDPLGNTTRYTYGAVGQLTQIFYPTHPYTAYLSMTYDTLGRPNQQFDANDNRTVLKLAGTRSEVDDPVGTAHVSYFTARGKTRANIEGWGSPSLNAGAGNLTTTAYDGLDRPILVTLPEGGSTATTYDQYSHPLSVTSTPKPSSGLATLHQYFSYVSPVPALPNFERPASATDPRGLVTRNGYDPATGNLLSSTADAGASPHFNATRRFSYDGVGRVLTATDPLGVVTSNSYDSFGNLLTRVRDFGGSGHLNVTDQFGYDAFGNAVSHTDPNRNATAFTYDADRRPLTVTDASGLTTTTVYDANDQVLSVTRTNQGLNVGVSATYTNTGQVWTTTDANNNVTHFSYDGADRLAQVTDPLGRVTQYGYDPLGRRTTVTNPAIQAAALQTQAYTPDGLLASLADASSHTTTFAYDGFDRLATITYPNASTETSSYDAASNLLTRKTRAGATISYAYDTLNRLCAKTWANNSSLACGGVSSTYLVSYSYDLDSRLTAVNDNGAAIPAVAGASAQYVVNTTYDVVNRPVKVTWNSAPPQTPPASPSTVTFGHARTEVSPSLADSARAAALAVTGHSPPARSAMASRKRQLSWARSLSSAGVSGSAASSAGRLASAQRAQRRRSGSQPWWKRSSRKCSTTSPGSARRMSMTIDRSSTVAHR